MSGSGRRVPDGDAGNPGLGVVDHLQSIVAEQGVQGLGGGDVFPADGDAGLGFGLAAFIDRVEAHLGIKDVIQARLAGEVFDGGGQLHVLELDERDDFLDLAPS